MHKYSFRVFWSDGDNGFVAVCPELPGVSAIGATEDEALREAKIAQELYIEDMIESGEALPEPQTAREYSGQFRVRLAKSLHRQAAEMAEQEGVSLNQYVNDAVAAKVSGEAVGGRYLEEIKRALAEQAIMRFGIIGLNTMVEPPGEPQPPKLTPTAIVPVIELGIQVFNEPNEFTVDAAEVNPAPKAAGKRGKKSGKKS